MSRHRGYVLAILPVVLIACADVIGADWDDVRPKGGPGAKPPIGGTASHTTGGTVSGSGGVPGSSEPGDGGGGASVGGGAASDAGVDQGGSGGSDAGQGGNDAGQGGNDGGHGGREEPEIVCGDGILSASSEECDDHNQLSGDGCSRQCELEPTTVVLSFDHSCALLGGAHVKCWGWNDAGALGLGDTFDRGATPSQMGDELPFVDLGSDRSARDLYAGDGYSCALLDDGSVKCWGHNARGELGLGHLRQLGDEPGEMGDALLPLELGMNERPASFALGASDGRCTLPEVTCPDTTRHGLGHTCVRFTSGRAKCWGVGTVGQLGLGDTSGRGGQEGDMGDQLPAVALGTAASVEMLATGSMLSCALLGGGSVKCWGHNSLGQLGLGDTEYRGDEPNEMGEQLPVVDLGRPATLLVTGSGHSCALLDDGSVKCWGRNSNGELGLGDTVIRGEQAQQMGTYLPSVDLGTKRKARLLSAGFAHTCALLEDGGVKCWGWNNRGQLGLGDTQNRGDEPDEMGDSLPEVDLGVGERARTIVAGGARTCALLVDGSLKCWGDNQQGKLGTGDTDNRGDNPGEMGDALPVIRLTGPAPQ